MIGSEVRRFAVIGGNAYCYDGHDLMSAPVCVDGSIDWESACYVEDFSEVPSAAEIAAAMA